MSESNVRAALDEHLSTMAGLPPVDWDNVGLTQNGDTYYSQSILPAEDITTSICSGSDVFAGIYQVTVCVPKNEGKLAFMVEVEKLRSRFAKATILNFSGTRVAIHKVWTSQPLIDENYYRVPVSIRYRGI